MASVMPDRASNHNRSLARSQELFRQASELTPGGVHSNVRWADPHPLYFERGRGSRIWDVDGNEYIDCTGNYGALILGHADPVVTRAVEQTLASGLTCGVETQLSIDVARRLTEMIPCAQRVRFCNSGTEAVMHALQIARGFTGRERILKTEGNYHGWYDYVYCSHRYPESEWRTPTAVPSSQGLSPDVARSTLVVPWNDLSAMEKVLQSHGDGIAAVILEPVDHNIGCALPRQGYLEGVRRLTREHGAVLIFDEVITGFRASPGGAQQYFNVTPDMATFAKAVANGYPLSVVAGDAKIMDVVAPERHQVSYGGTYNGSQLVLAAAAATLDRLRTGEVQQHLRDLTERLATTFNEDAGRLQVDVRLQGFGGKFQVYFTSEEVVDWRSASRVDQALYHEFQSFMVRHGVLWVASPFSHNALTWAHTGDEVDTILALAREFLAQLRQR